MAENLEFDDEASRLVEEFNCSKGATERRRRITAALDVQQGDVILDVGSGPGNQAFELSSVVGPSGRIHGVDPADSAIAIASKRCSELSNVQFDIGDVAKLPFESESFDAVMSSQVFEYLEGIGEALSEVYRVLKPGGTVLIHDTDWGALLWHASDAARMSRILQVWEGHLTHPSLPQSLRRKLIDAGFAEVRAEPVVQLETEFERGSVSDILMQFVVGYVESQGIPSAEATAWKEDLETLGATGDYFFNSNEYIFTGRKPA